MEYTENIGGRRVRIFSSAGDDRGSLYLIGGDGLSDAFEKNLFSGYPVIAVVECLDWNRELSPWQAEKVFAKGSDFSGGAPEFLKVLTETVIPETEKTLGFVPSCRGIAGYSLAGLFALWSLYQTEMFDRAASMSGSLWFDGFPEYAENAPMKRIPSRLYLSYGEREPKTKNPRMMTVGICTDRLTAYYASRGIPVTEKIHTGGHFDFVEQRILEGLWVLGKKTD